MSRTTTHEAVTHETVTHRDRRSQLRLVCPNPRVKSPGTADFCTVPAGVVRWRIHRQRLNDIEGGT